MKFYSEHTHSIHLAQTADARFPTGEYAVCYTTQPQHTKYKYICIRLAFYNPAVSTFTG